LVSLFGVEFDQVVFDLESEYFVLEHHANNFCSDFLVSILWFKKD